MHKTLRFAGQMILLVTLLTFLKPTEAQKIHQELDANPHQSVRRGERPPINLMEIDVSAYESDRIHVKFNKSAENYLVQKMIIQDENGNVRTGNNDLDRLNQEISVRQYTSLINGLYEKSTNSVQFEQRHRQWEFHLWFEIILDEKTDVLDAIERYKALDMVEHAEPVFKRGLIEPVGASEPLMPQEKSGRWTPNDPLYANNQWHFNNTGQTIQNVPGLPGVDISLENAWNIEKGNPSVIVAIVDNGVEFTHVDLQANMWPDIGPEGTNTVPASHGTHVAGTVAALTNNGIGVAGIAGGSGNGDGVRLMSVNLLEGEHNMSDLALFVYQADNGVAISQNSWVFQEVGAYNQSTLDGIDYFNTHGGGTALINGGITIFGAANENDDGNWYPAYYSGTMAVAAYTNTGEKSDFSNYGYWIDISAPGTGIASTDLTDPNPYTFKNGTSMACPHVSGVAALLVSHAYGTLTPTQLWNLLVDNVDDIYQYNPGYIGQLGSGGLNAHTALLALDDVEDPTDPTEVVFYEDFADGLPETWENIVVTGPEGFPGWEYTTVGGEWGGQLNSTTAGNGYMMLDSDAHGAFEVMEEAHLITPSIDLSLAVDNVQFSMEHLARTFGNAEVYIYLSTDDFVTQTLLYEWANAEQNEANNHVNPLISVFDITELAAEEPNVKFKFKWIGSWDYWWLLDDIKITATMYQEPQQDSEPLFSQTADVSSPSGATSAFREGVNYEVADNFSDVDGTLTQVHFSGLYAIYDGSNWANVDPGDQLFFNIRIYEDDPVQPDWGNPVHEFIHVPTEEINYSWSWNNGFDVFDFVVNIPETYVDNGWISIQSSGGNGWLLWSKSVDGDEYAWQKNYNAKGNEFAFINAEPHTKSGALEYDLAFTLKGYYEEDDPVDPDPYTVTFHVDMRTAPGFDPENDVVYMTGSMFGWQPPGDDHEAQSMSRVGDTWIWSKTLSLDEDTYEYKYFVNAGWDGGEWGGDPNRIIYVDDDMVINDIWGFVGDFISCEPYDLPVSENFDDVDVPNLPECWYAIHLGGDVRTTSSVSYSSPNSIELIKGPNDEPYFISPPLAENLGDLRISFAAKTHFLAYGTPTLEIGTMGDPANTETFNYITHVTVSEYPYQEFNVVFSGYDGDHEHIAFRLSDDIESQDLDVSIDDIVIDYNIFTLSLSAEPEEAGSVIGAGIYMVGEEVTVTAEANTGFEFVNWRKDEIAISDEAEYTFNMPTSDIDLVAHFVPEGTDLYDVAIDVDPENSGYTTGQGTYEEGTLVNVQAFPNEGYVFDFWADDDALEEASNPYQFTMPDENVNLIANFRDVIDATINPDNWVFDTFDDFETVQTNIIWNDATEVTSVYVEINGHHEQFQYDVEPIDEETAILHIGGAPDKNIFNFKEEAIINGYVTFDNGNPAPFTLTFTDPEWWVDIWVFNQETLMGIPDAEIYITETSQTYYTNIAGDVWFNLPAGDYTLNITAAGYYPVDEYPLTVEAGFDGNVYDIPMSPHTGYELTLNVDMTNAVAYGDVEFDPDVHDVYVTGTFSQWAEPGSDIDFKMQAVEAKGGIYTITFDASPGEHMYKYFLVEDEPTWDYGEWSGGPDRIIILETDMEVDNVFGSLNMLTLLVNPEDAGNIEGEGMYPDGNPVQVHAFPEPGYEFLNWTHDGGIVSTEAAFDFTMPDEDATLTANFSEIVTDDYTVTFNVDMRTAPGFDPENDVVYITGTMFDWAIPGSQPENQTMERVGDTWVWSKTITLAEGFYEYKHFLNDGWDNGEWLADRGITVFEDATVNNFWGFMDTPPMFDLTLVADPADGGTIDGAGNYLQNETVTVTATANDGFNFLNWTEGGEVISTSASFDYVIPDYDATLTANFLSDDVPLYTLTLVAEPATGGTVSGGGQFQEGDVVSVSAAANDGYFFVNWTHDGNEVSTDPVFDFTMPDDDATLTANFNEIVMDDYTVTFNVDMRTAPGFDPENDVVYITGSMFIWAIPGTQPENQTMERVDDTWIWSKTMTLETGTYEYKYFLNAGWDGGEWDGGPNRELVVNEDTSTDDFWGFIGTPPSFDLTLIADPAEGGTVDGAGEYMQTETVTVTAIANDGFNFINWTEGDNVVSTNASFNYVIPDYDATLTANFLTDDVPVYTVTLMADPEAGGAIFGAGNYEEGAQVTITAVPKTGYYFLNWSNDDGIVTTNTSYQFEMPDENLTFTANFAEIGADDYTVTFHVDMRTAPGFDPENDVVYITGSMLGWQTPGDDPENQTMERVDETWIWSKTLTIAGGNYAYKHFLNDGWDNGEWAFGDDRVILVFEDATVNNFWGFMGTPPSFDLTLVADPAEGGTVDGAGNYMQNETVTITATANDGFNFLNWTEGDNVISTSASFNYVIPDYDATLTANFLTDDVPLHTLTLVADPADGGTVSEGGQFEEGTVVSVSATAEEGYYFENWTHNGTEVSTDPVFDFTMPDSDVTLTANFIEVGEDMFVLHLEAAPEYSATVSGGGIYPAGEIVTVSAEPAEGFDFGFWLQGAEVVSYNTTFDFEMPAEDVTLTAILEYLVEGNMVEFFVDMSTAPGFDPENDVVYMTGSMFDWETPGDDHAAQSMFRLGDSWIWSKTLLLDEGTYEYKYFLNAGWDGGEWEGDPNREIVVSGYMEVNDFWGFIGTPPSFDLTLLADPAEGGTVDGAGTYMQSETVTITATANDGFNFLNWTEDGTVISTSPGFGYVIPEYDATLTANFEAIAIPEYTLTLLANPTEGGVVSGGGQYEAGTVVSVSATPDEGFIFVNWTQNDDLISTDATFNFTMPAMDVTLTAFFDLASTAANLAESQMIVFPNPATHRFTVYSDQIIHQLMIWDTNGRVVLSKETNTRELSVEKNLQAGMYILQIFTKNGVVQRKLQVQP